jgi:phosphate-selective porin
VDATIGSPVTYNASYSPLSFSLGGERRAYSPGSVGVFNGGITRRV